MRTPAVTQTPAAPPALQRPSNLSQSTSSAPRAAAQDPMQGVVQSLARESKHCHSGYWQTLSYDGCRILLPNPSQLTPTFYSACDASNLLD